MHAHATYKRMQADFHWRELPTRERVVEDAADLVLKHERGVPPIIHSGYSEADYKKAKQEADKENMQEITQTYLFVCLTCNGSVSRTLSLQGQSVVVVMNTVQASHSRCWKSRYVLAKHIC